MQKIGVLLVNLGTPRSPTLKSIRAYLKEFLSDPRVIDIPKVLRVLLLYLIILPFRPRKILRYYQKIWTTEGSPLLLYSKKLAGLVRRRLDPERYTVALAMRYGEPSLPEAMALLKSCARIQVLPLYPQYATSSTGTVLARLSELNAELWDPKPLDVLLSYYAEPGFIQAYAATIRASTEQFKGHLLFSFHSVPLRHLVKSGCSQSTCPEFCERPDTCYLYQCYQTAKLIAIQLGIAPENYSVAFQSRLGRTPWIQPYTDQWLPVLAKRGVRNLAIASPSFIVDCLEPLDEVGNRLCEQWKELGGEEFISVPCLNDSADFAEFLAKQVTTMGEAKTYAP